MAIRYNYQFWLLFDNNYHQILKFHAFLPIIPDQVVLGSTGHILGKPDYCPIGPKACLLGQIVCADNKNRVFIVRGLFEVDLCLARQR